uniref:Uncharacterized protein n=1 Tax=Vitis vinifera TaxID=29760 RepID=A5B1H7_VITVI|nr:hypothetical protein VITISV_034716 [Vitis vinifera]
MQGERQGEEENRVKKTEDKQLQSSCALLEHFPKSIFYILYTISKLRKSRIQCFNTVRDSELKRRSYSHCKQITPKCCEISLLLREFRSLFVQCYGIPPEATRYMPQAGTLRTSRWKPISQPCEFNLLLRKYFAALLGVCEISQTPFSPAKCHSCNSLARKCPRKGKLPSYINSLASTIKRTLGEVINFVDHSLNQGAPVRHESAETPIGHESNGAVAGDRTSNQMVPLPLLGTNQDA